MKGTTTDPVYKAMELLPIGPVVFIDTAGIDDISAIGALRIEKTTEVLDKMDISILVISAETILEDEILSFEQEWIKKIKDKKNFISYFYFISNEDFPLNKFRRFFHYLFF